ncbi:MAG: hypothetical protein IKT52_04180 [Oscillospiraceae bacterium]|nr:hypothetical protein [Oscillospiraceae bacterium]
MDGVVAAVKSKINVLLEEKDFVLIAIDGKCTSGKTTLLPTFSPVLSVCFGSICLKTSTIPTSKSKLYLEIC